MPPPPSPRAFAVLTALLAAILLVALALAYLAWTAIRPLAPGALAATQTARPDLARTATPTPIPTLAAVGPELLVCQRQVALAMNARQMVGAARLAADGELRLRWVSTEGVSTEGVSTEGVSTEGVSTEGVPTEGVPTDGAVESLDDALPGVIQGLDAALDVWQEGCAAYDRVTIDVLGRSAIGTRDRAEERQALRLTVQARMEDLLKWRAGEIGDRDLLARLDVIRAENE